MKKFFSALALITVFSFANAQDTTYQAEPLPQVVQLEAKSKDLAEKIAQIQTAYKDLSVQLDSLRATDTKLVMPTTVEEANGVLVYILSFIQFVFVGFMGDKLPKWLSPFVLSVIVGTIIAVVAYFFSGGEFTLNEAFMFFLSVSGGSNIIHQIKKPAKVQPLPAPTPTPI